MSWGSAAAPMFSIADPRAAAISRRTWFALAALPRIRAGSRCAPVERLLLASPTPWKELALACSARGLRTPLRVVARPGFAWWPHPQLLPERWQAWIEFADGTAVVAECAPRGATETERPERISTVTRAVAAALRREDKPLADLAASTA